MRNPEGNYIVPGVQGDIVYRRVNGIELSLDAYVQKKGTRRPAVVIIHGGGFTSGSRVAFTGQFQEMLARAGYNWFSVDYRLGGLKRYADALDDVKAALAFIRCHADEFRTDHDRIAVLGEDTGGQLAALLAAEKPAGVKAAVLIGGVYEPRELKRFRGEADEDMLARASVFSHVVRGMPDMLIVHGAADIEVPPDQARRYPAALQRAGVSCDYLLVAGAIHRPENWRPEQWGYKAKVVTWLNKKLGLLKADHLPWITRLKKDIPYLRIETVSMHGKSESQVRELAYDCYVPPGKGPFPAVLIFHGGGWEAGDKVTYITPILETLAKAGFAWFSFNYRLTPEVHHPEQLDDLRMAISGLPPFIRYLTENARIDLNRIAILGESASGQMVAQLATEARSDIAAVVSFYGVYDFEAMAGSLTPRSIPARLFGITALGDEARATLRRFSPLHNVKKDMPPLLLICGTKDGLLAQQAAFTAQLDKVGARYEAFTVEGAPHGMENWEGHPEWADYKQKLTAWLRNQLQVK
ncbi:MAG TPA: alpha/beta hydrolase [Blastocatellia bacterium]|nr:alpha/beta hydrolase [Blastocatellia bacterium]